MAVDIDHRAIQRELFPEQPEGYPLEEFDIYDINLPDNDDLGIQSDDDNIDEEDIATETGFGSVVVVSNLPQVPEEKYEKLCTVVRKLFTRVGAIREGGMSMPLDDNKVTKGFCFIEMDTPGEAQAARDQTNGFKLDKLHTLSVDMFDDFEKYGKVPDAYTAPDVTEYTPQDNLFSWMLDKLGRDQFVVRHGDDCSVYWNDGKRSRAEQVYTRQYWTESFVQLSPNGTLVTTVHRQGVAVWGGPNFPRLQRFQHAGVRLLDISPNERFLVTYSSAEPVNARDSATVTLNIFDIRDGRKLRGFEGPADEYALQGGPGGAMKWPVFKWAGGKQDQYFAKLGKGAIGVYSTEDMGLLDKKSVKVEGIVDFEWSPVDPIMCAYTVEQGNLPARIVLLKIPERTEIRQKNLFSVSDIKIYWHPQGDYLAVKVDRYTKTKKSTFTGFELFSIHDKDIPMEVLELPNKSDKVLSFAWEPRGHRFAIVHGSDTPTPTRPSVSFYSMKDEKGRMGVKHICTLANKATTQISWSPQGHNIVMAGLKSMNGQLEFFNVDEQETMATAEHFMCTDVEWDPTGRYVSTFVSSNVHQMENGFNIWTFSGKLLYMQAKDRLTQFAWRPRLDSLLPVEKEAEIVKNLKQYSKRYDEEDEALLQQADADVLLERRNMLEDWDKWLASKADSVSRRMDFLRQTLGPAAEEKEFRMDKATIEQLLELKEEPYNPR